MTTFRKRLFRLRVYLAKGRLKDLRRQLTSYLHEHDLSLESVLSGQIINKKVSSLLSEIKSTHKRLIQIGFQPTEALEHPKC